MKLAAVSFLGAVILGESSFQKRKILDNAVVTYSSIIAQRQHLKQTKSVQTFFYWFMKYFFCMVPFRHNSVEIASHISNKNQFMAAYQLKLSKEWLIPQALLNNLKFKGILKFSNFSKTSFQPVVPISIIKQIHNFQSVWSFVS